MYRRKPKSEGYWWLKEWNGGYYTPRVVIVHKLKDEFFVDNFYTSVSKKLSSIHQKSLWEKVKLPSN